MVFKPLLLSFYLSIWLLREAESALYKSVASESSRRISVDIPDSLDSNWAAGILSGFTSGHPTNNEITRSHLKYSSDSPTFQEINVKYANYYATSPPMNKRLDQITNSILSLKYNLPSMGKFETQILSRKIDILEASRDDLEEIMNNMPSENVRGPKSKMKNMKNHSPWLALGDSIINNLKQVINDDTLLKSIPIGQQAADDKKIIDLLLFQRAGLSMVDFLIDCDAATPEIVKTMFQDTKTVETFIHYIYHRFNLEIRTSIFEGSPHITQHWYWPLLHSSLRVLSDRENRLISTTLVVAQSTHVKEKIPVDYLHSPEWLAFSHVFDRSSLCSEIPNNNLIKIKQQISGMIDLLLLPANPQQIKRGKKKFDARLFWARREMEMVLVKMLELFDGLYPGLIKDVSVQHRKPQEFNKRFELIMYSLKLHGLSQQAFNCRQFLKELISPNNCSDSNLFELVMLPAFIELTYFKDFYETCIKNLENLAPIFEERVSYVLRRNNESDNTLIWLKSQEFINQVASYFHSWIDELKEKSPELLRSW